MNYCSMCGTGDMFCFGLMNNADLITDILNTEDSYNVISCVDISDKSYNNNSTTKILRRWCLVILKTLSVRHVKGIKGNNGGDSAKSNIGSMIPFK